MRTTIFTLVATLTILIQANAQGLVKEWESAPNTRPASLSLTSVQNPFIMDFDGDGYRDIPLFMKERPDSLVRLTVISGKDKSTKWEFPLSGFGLNFEEIEWNLVGFFDIDSSNGDENEALLVNGPREAGRFVAIVNQNGILKIFADGFESGAAALKGIKDYDNDSDDEMLLYIIGQGVMELWGKGN